MKIEAPILANPSRNHDLVTKSFSNMDSGFRTKDKSDLVSDADEYGEKLVAFWTPRIALVAIALRESPEEKVIQVEDEKFVVRKYDDSLLVFDRFYVANFYNERDLVVARGRNFTGDPEIESLVVKATDDAGDDVESYLVVVRNGSVVRASKTVESKLELPKGSGTFLRKTRTHVSRI